MAVNRVYEAGVCLGYSTSGVNLYVQQGGFCQGEAERVRAESHKQDMESVMPAVSALKKLALLEPDLVMPALMERVIPSLQGLEEVGPRTFSC